MTLPMYLLCMYVYIQLRERKRESYLINRMNVAAISCVYHNILKTLNSLVNFDQIIKTKSHGNGFFLLLFFFETINHRHFQRVFGVQF